MSTISAAGVYPLIVSSGRDLDSSTTGETNEKKRELAYLIEKTRRLYTQLSMLSAGGFYNRSLKRSIQALSIEILDSLPSQKDGRVLPTMGMNIGLPLDTNPLAYKSERFALRTLAMLMLEELGTIHKKHLLTGYFRTSRAAYTLGPAFRDLDMYAHSTQGYSMQTILVR